MTDYTDPDRAACAGMSDIFTSPLMFDHRIAVRYCLGDGDRPACPRLTACAEETPERINNHDGTYAGVLFHNGLEIARYGKAPKRGRVVA